MTGTMERYFRSGKSEREYKTDLLEYVRQHATITSDQDFHIAVIGLPGVIGTVQSAAIGEPDTALIRICRQIYQSVNLSNAAQRVLYPETIRIIEKPDDNKKQKNRR